MDYWNRKAIPWVSVSVLAGGLVSAVLLFWISKIESTVHITSV